MALVIFHLQDNAGVPLGGVTANATSTLGNWSSVTNQCGDVVDPGDQIAGVTLAPGSYSITFSKPGYATHVLAATIGGSGVIRQALDSGAPVLPAVPARAHICGLRTSLQGLTYQTAQWGSIPAWFYGALTTTDQAAARAAHKAAGDTHIPVPISEAYRESGTLWPADLREGYDFAYDLDSLRTVLLSVIMDGLFVDLPLAGDGMSRSPHPSRGEYNDPVGKTYGFQWLMQELPRIVRGLQGDGTAARPDLTPYILFRPGWDACFYGWSIDFEVPDLQPTRVRQFGELFRSLLPQGHLAIEHTPGNIPVGNGPSDYAPGGMMTTYDTVLSEFGDVHSDSCWQVVARMVPSYTRPPDQPASDDPHPPHYLAVDTLRGPYFYVAFEPTIGGVYQWARGQCTLADVNAVRAYTRAMGCTLVG